MLTVAPLASRRDRTFAVRCSSIARHLSGVVTIVNASTVGRHCTLIWLPLQLGVRRSRSAREELNAQDNMPRPPGSPGDRRHN